MSAEPSVLLVGTRKGAFVLPPTRHARLDGQAPMFLGHIVHHAVLDPRDRRTLLVAAGTGHLGPTVFRSTDLGRTWTEAYRRRRSAPASDSERASRSRVLAHARPRRRAGVWYAGGSPQGLFRIRGRRRHVGAGRRLERPRDVGDLGRVARARTPRRVDAALGHRRSARPASTSTSACPAGASSRAPTAAPTGRRSTRDAVADFFPDPNPEFGHDPHCVRLHPLQPDRLYQQNHCGIYRHRPPGQPGCASATTCRARSATSASRSSCTRAIPTPRGCSRWTAPTSGRAPARTVARPPIVTRDARRDAGSAATAACPSEAWFTVKRQAMTADAARSGRRVLRHHERRGVGAAPTKARPGRRSRTPPGDLLGRGRRP